MLFDDDFSCALCCLNDVNTGFQGVVADPLSRDAIDYGVGEVDGFGFDLEFLEMVVAEEGDKGDETEAGIVNLMNDMVFNGLFAGGAPVIAYGGDVAAGVVIEVVGDASVAVAVDLVAAPFLFRAEVDVMKVDGGDAPEVAGDDVPTDNGLVVDGGAVDGDAAAAVHGVVLVDVVDKLVFVDEGGDGLSLLVVAVASVFDDVVLEEHLGVADAQEVGDGDAASMIDRPGAVDVVADNADGVFAAGTEVDLRHVEVVHIRVEFAVGDLWGALAVGRRADGGSLVQHEIAVVDDRVAVEDVDGGVAVVGGEIHKLHIVEGDVRLDDFDASAVGEIHLMQVAFGGVLEPHAEGIVFAAIDLDTFCVGAGHGSVDGDEDAGGVDADDLVVDEQHVLI